MTRTRKIKNRDLPPNLYKRNGYYSYKEPAYTERIRFG
ncbi:MAG: phage integrase Arm DNA-binding domain-containing protein [Candidatus Arsenophonus phytopathogenicus]